MNFLIYASMIVLSLGLLTSTSLLPLSHIMITVPIFYLLPKVKWKSIPVSAWLLLGLATVIVSSVFINREIMIEGLKPALKAKYFFFGFFMIGPFSLFFKNYSSEKKIKILFWCLLISSLIAGFAGTTARLTGHNPILMRAVSTGRNSGLSGMVLNYAHNLAFFEVIVCGLVIFSIKRNMNLINLKTLIIIFVLNFYFLFTTFTRGALIAFVVSVPFYFVKQRKVFILTSIFLILSSIVVFKISGKSLVRPDSDFERASYWKTALKAVEERPFLGFGYTNFEKHSLDLKKRYGLEVSKHGHAHNNYLEMLASTGLIGFLFFLLWILYWFKEMYQRYDLMSQITIPLIVSFCVGGLTQSTICIGFNLFFIMSIYALSQQNPSIVE